MPRYYFDVWEGSTIATDEDGVDLGGPDEVRTEARQLLALMARHSFKDHTISELRVVVRDDAKAILEARLVFHMEMAN